MAEKEIKSKLAGLEVTPEVEKLPEAPKAKPRPEVAPLKAEKVFEVPRSAPVAQAPSVPVSAKDLLLSQVENILSEDMQSLYAALPTELKPKFKAKGEEVAMTIKTMLERAKVKTRKILKLIREWLKMIPGVNKFFLEQAAAIKTQKISVLAEQQKKKQ